MADRADAVKDDAVGRGPEEVGGATDMQAEGKGQQTRGKIEEGVENVTNEFR